MFRLTSLILLVGAVVCVSAYPPGYVPQRCQDDDGNLLPSATDCEDEDPMCPSLFGNITTDVRAKACNSEIDVVKEGVMMCAKTCKVCCEKPKPPIPEPVSPGYYHLRCQDENGNLLPSATDCEDGFEQCPEIYGNITTDVRSRACNGDIYKGKETPIICAKSCKICCEREDILIPELTTTEPELVTERESYELDLLEGDDKPHCQYSNGTLMESARNCEDKYPEPCSEMFIGMINPYPRPLRCYAKALHYFAVHWCPQTCGMCCEAPQSRAITST
uniref:ShKT domain-containing protein n=1 Tax=Panagrellus redivivus TaxID=6233 RepID=A0A7E4WDQ3_PANRE